MCCAIYDIRGFVQSYHVFLFIRGLCTRFPNFFLLSFHYRLEATARCLLWSCRNVRLFSGATVAVSKRQLSAGYGEQPLVVEPTASIIWFIS